MRINNTGPDPVARIKGAAHRRITTNGPAGMDLAAVAADAGIETEQLHRHYARRDDLLTAMILDAYNAMGAAAEESDRRAVEAGASPLHRWVAICRSVRIWVMAHPQEYTLIWGPPLPGYGAPPETMIAGARTALALIGVLRQADSQGQLSTAGAGSTFSGGMRRNVETLAGGMLVGLAPDVIARVLVAWTQLLGALSFSVYGHVNGFAADPDAFFDHAAEAMGKFVGLQK